MALNFIKSGVGVTFGELAELGISSDRIAELESQGFAVIQFDEANPATSIVTFQPDIGDEGGGVEPSDTPTPPSPEPTPEPTPEPVPTPEPAPEPSSEPAPAPEPAPTSTAPQSEIGGQGGLTKTGKLTKFIINELQHALEMAYDDKATEIANQIEAVLANPTLETIAANPLAAHELQLKLKIADVSTTSKPEPGSLEGNKKAAKAFKEVLNAIANLKKSTPAAAAPAKPEADPSEKEKKRERKATRHKQMVSQVARLRKRVVTARGDQLQGMDELISFRLVMELHGRGDSSPFWPIIQKINAALSRSIANPTWSQTGQIVNAMLSVIKDPVDRVKFGRKLYESLTEEERELLLDTGLFEVHKGYYSKEPFIGAARVSVQDLQAVQAAAIIELAREEAQNYPDKTTAALAGAPLPEMTNDKRPLTARKRKRQKMPFPRLNKFLFAIQSAVASNIARSVEELIESFVLTPTAEIADKDKVVPGSTRSLYNDAPPISASELGDITSKVQDYLASTPSEMQTPSHFLTAQEDNAASFMHEGQEQIGSMTGKQPSMQSRFVSANQFETEHGFTKAGNPIREVNRNGVLVFASRESKFYGFFNPTTKFNVRIIKVNGKWEISNASASEPLADNETFITLPCISVTVDESKSAGVGGKTSANASHGYRQGLRDTLLHEMWHALLMGTYAYAPSTTRLADQNRHAGILAKMKSEAPMLYSMVMRSVNPVLQGGYDTEADKNQERAVRIAAKISALILSDPAELDMVLRSIAEEAKRLDKEKTAIEWMKAALSHASSHILAVVGKFYSQDSINQMLRNSEELTGESFTPATSQVGTPSGVQAEINEYLTKIAASDPEKAEAAAMRLAMMASEIKAIAGFFDASGMKTPNLDVEFSTALYKTAVERNANDALMMFIDFIRAANSVYRPVASYMQSRFTSAVTGPMRVGLEEQSATPQDQETAEQTANVGELIIGEPVEIRETGISSADTVTAIDAPRMISSKSISGRKLPLVGVGFTSAWRIAKSVIKQAIASDTSLGRRKPSIKDYYAANRDRFASVEDKYHSLFLDMDAIREMPAYKSMNSRGKAIFEAAASAAVEVRGNDLSRAVNTKYRLPTQHEESIAELVASTGATGDIKSTLEFLVRVLVNDQFGDQISDNASRKAGDPGWEIPPIKEFEIDDRGDLVISTGTIAWDLIGDENSKKARNARKAVAVNRIIDRVKDLIARADSDPQARRIIEEQNWYNNIFDRLVVAFGGQQAMFTELLAALSPQTPADTNYRYAVQAIANFSKGEYDALIEAYVKWREDVSRIALLQVAQDAEDRRDAFLERKAEKLGLVGDAKKAFKANDAGFARLKQERAKYELYTGETPFKEIIVTQGQMLPTDPYENKHGQVITPKSKPFLTIDNLIRQYGPKKPDFNNDERAFRKAQKEWIATLKESNPHAFDRRGRLIDGASLAISRKFGINSRAALDVMAGLWATNIRSPKVHTFYSNLAGLGTNATIDLWAARAIRSALGLPRIPAYAEGSVKGKPVKGNINEISGEYAFGQEIMTEAAVALGMEPMNLQALLWFAEKDVWDENGWTSKAGGGGSFERSFDRDPLTLIETRVDLSSVEPESTLLRDFLTELNSDDSVVSMQYINNPRSQNGRHLNINMTVRYLDFDTNGFADKITSILKSAGSTGRVTVAQSVPFGIEKSDNARPAFSVLFAKPKTVESALGMIASLENMHPGWHFEPMIDGRLGRNGAFIHNPAVGLRIHYASEIDPAMRRNSMSSADDVTASQDTLMQLRTDELLNTLSSMYKRGIINNSAKPLAVEAITYGLQGVPNDKQGMAAFTDYRSGKPIGSRSVQAITAEAVGIESRLGGVAVVGDEPADGYPEGTDSIAERVVPEEIEREHRMAIAGHFPDDGEMTVENVGEVKPTKDKEPEAPTAPSSDPIDSVDFEDIALPEELKTLAPGTGIIPKLKSVLGLRGKEVKIVTRRKPNDLGMIRRWLSPLISSAWGSSNRVIRFVAEEIVATDMERQRVTMGVEEYGKNVYSKLPREYRKDNGKKFFMLMDRFYDPNKPNSDPQWVDGEGKRIPDDVIEVLREFKRIDEDQRLGIVAAKRDAAREAVSFMSMNMIVRVANENGASWSIQRVRYGRRRGEVQTFVVDDTTGDMMTVDEAREAIVMVMVPDDWGRQFAHAFHAFFGSYEGFWYSKKAYREAIARGRSEQEALADSRRSIAMDGGTATSATEAEMVRRLLSFRKAPPPGIDKDDIGRVEIKVQTYVPPDVVRVSGRQYDALRRHIQEAADIESSMASSILRGRVGRMEGKKRFYAPLLQRTGKEGFDMDFMRAWQAQTSGYYKWLYFNKLRKSVTSSIEDLRRQGYVGWASHFEDTLDYMTTMRQSQFEQAMDGIVSSIPVMRTMVGPMPTRRWLQMLRTANVVRQLWTVRQQFVNSLQPFQTVFPILGTRRFVDYIKRYNSREGKDILARYGYMRPNGEYYEGREFKLTSGTGWLSGAYDSIKKIMAKAPLSGAEARNQNFTFVAFYLYGKELGMSDNDAARHALLRVAQTQFAFTKGNNPPIFRGPTRATLLQYKRFMVSSFALAYDGILNARHPVTGEKLPGLTRTAMMGRWLSTFLVQGGLKGMPVWILLDALARILTDEGKKAAGYDIYQGLREQLGEDWANVVVMGLPAAAGVDISGSIVLFPKPYGRTAYDMVGAFVAGPSLSAVGDIIGSAYNKDAIYQSGFREAWNAVYASSPAASQIGNAIDIMASESEQYDVQGRLKFRKTVAEQVRGVMGFRTIRESLESLEYNKIIAMNDALDGLKDEIATLAASGMIVEMQQKIRQWNAMFPDMPLPYRLSALMKDVSIGRRIKRKLDDRTFDTRQRRLKGLNDKIAKRLVDKYGIGTDAEDE